MPPLSLREASRAFAVSRATLTKALESGKVSGVRDDAGYWQIDPAELARVYEARRPTKEVVNRPKPDDLSHDDPAQKPAQIHGRPPADDLALRLARAETALEAEREKTAILERHLADLRAMLPAPESRRRRRWWPWR